ncbi:26S proteasome non-ATPase regulatory subunit 9 [Phtheirospermum japonicum]|uniref:26S proteasome non-ATPase regulatory subunit 9 n=1 Tax=Phtheirospermum japonicum TaxID=374723 RepID=A0A830D7H2_9LAMI|nr:26S proteasome non-ATPase regulatory subunit 9 [Phtheirospermum japonicum]
MVATNLKAEIMKLMEKRSGMEEEMNVIIEGLCRPGGPGLSGNLVDSEANFIFLFFGFPRADIDIPAVRAERHRLGELRNDHKNITEKISKNIELLHSAKLTPTTAYVKDSDSKDQDANVGMSSSSNNPISGGASIAMDVDFVLSRPFAMVDEITEASPAAEDGLQLGDQIVKFGDVERGENLLQRLAAEPQQKQGQAVSLLVMRQGALINLKVTPREWSGSGLLG